MKTASDKDKPRQPQHVRIQIVTRAFPFENVLGAHSYLLSLLRYFKQIGFEIRLVLLDSAPAGGAPFFVIPASAGHGCHVSARDNFRVGPLLLRFRPFSDWLAAPIWVLYYLVPRALRHTTRCKTFYLTLNRIQTFLANVFDATGNKAYAWDALGTTQEKAFVRAQFMKYKPHVIIANYAFLGDVLSVIPSAKLALKVIITHDVRHRRVMHFMKRSLDLLDESEWDVAKESEQLRKAQLLLAIHQDDADVFKKTATPCEVLSMPMPAVCQSYASKQTPGRCLFVGSRANHNVYGLSWFLEDVWPIVLQLVGYCGLHVCGTVSDKIHGTFPNVAFLGRVADLKSEYGAAEVCLVPLLVGSGLKIKLVEALSHVRACVSTPVGVQGISEIAGKAVIVAETAEDFARSVQTILTNSDKRRWMEQQAHEFIRERLSPDAVYQPFVDRIYSHLQQSEKN